MFYKQHEIMWTLKAGCFSTNGSGINLNDPYYRPDGYGLIQAWGGYTLKTHNFAFFSL